MCVQIGFLGPAFFLTQLGRVHSPFAAVACMMASQGLDAFSQSGLYSNHQVGAEATTLPVPIPIRSAIFVALASVRAQGLTPRCNNESKSHVQHCCAPPTDIAAHETADNR